MTSVSRNRFRKAATIWGEPGQISFYGLIVGPIILCAALYAGCFTSYGAASLRSIPDHVVYYARFLWFAGLLVVVPNLIGLLWFGSPQPADTRRRDESKQQRWDDRKLLIVVYVSRGDNHEALDRSLRHSLGILDAMQVNFRIEVVTDLEVAHRMPALPCVYFHVVPEQYTTAKQARYKARALHYLVEQRKKVVFEGCAENVWLLHLDEESILTHSVIEGIQAFIGEPVNRDTIGQGEIKYNAYRYGSNLLITVLDSLRTGDDLGRFRFQYRCCHRPLFGMHGSFILVPLHLEQQIGFDLSSKGSITEDAYFALIASDRGCRYGWVEGYIREQSPFTVGALIRQRRRWYCGLRYLVLDPAIRLRTRTWLLLSVLSWSLSWLAPIVVMMNIFHRVANFPLGWSLVCGVMQGGFIAVYLVGTHRNTLDLNWSRGQRLSLYILTVALLPVAGAIEGIAVLYAIMRPVKVFDVIAK